MKWGIASMAFVGASAFVGFAMPQLTTVEYDRTHVVADVVEDIKEEMIDTREVVQHVPLPEQVKTIYMSS